jgi:DNA-binding transcriptional regulator YdaS (Cro superfamily)
MGYETVMQHFKTAAALAEALAPYGEFITTQAIYKWRDAGVPVERAPLIEDASGGKVRCEQIVDGWKWIRDGRGNLVARQMRIQRPKLRRKAA